MSSKPHAPEVCVKQELDWDEETSGDELRAQGPASAQHVHLKEELVQHLKEEAEWEDKVLDGVSESAALVDLYAGHEVKDELVLGPEGPQPRDVAFTLYAAQALNVKEKPVLKDCVVHLERVDHPSTAGRASKLTGHVENNVDMLNKIHTSTNIEATENYVCDICKKRYTLKTQLMEHVMIHFHQSAEDESVCGVPDSAGQALNVKEKPVLKDCVVRLERIDRPSTAGRATRLTGHVEHNVDMLNKINTSTNIEATENYVCDICKKRYTLKTQLMEHVMIHIHQSAEQDESMSGVPDSAAQALNVKEKPVLKDCVVRLERIDRQSTAGRASRITGHVEHNVDMLNKINTSTNIETTENYVCDICKKRYTLKTQLMEHVMIHIHQSAEQDESMSGVPDSERTQQKYRGIRSKSNKSRVIVGGYLDNEEMETDEEQEASVSRQVYSDTRADVGETPAVKHLKTAHITKGTTPFKCSNCSFACACKSSLVIHERKHTRAKPYKCSHCSYAAARKSNIVVHERKHTGEKPYKCRHCSFTSVYKSSVVAHEIKHTGEKPYKCSYCSYASAQKSHIRVHETKHTGEKPYKCSHCSYASVYKSYLLVHERKHTGAKTHKCSHCSYASVYKSHIVVHERKHTGEKPYKCTHCSYATTCKCHIVVHERKHTGEKPYKCSHCSFACAYKSHIVVHERKHTGEKPYKCSHCNFASVYKSNTVAHEIKHTGEKPYKCSYCSYASAQKSHIRVHETKHTGEKPYKCSHCSYASVYKSYLLVHERKHTGDKTHKCSHCSYASVYKSHIVVHERKHTGEKPYKCTHCSFASFYKSNLLVHEKKHYVQSALGKS